MINDKYLVAVATDRISAFDVILPRPIPYKGQVLNQLAAHFLKATGKIVPNWLTDTPDPNVSIGKKAQPFAIEMVIRGCLVGHAWREYQAGKRELCGSPMPKGLQEYDEFPNAIITPSTKADEGHDEDITAEQIVERGLATETQWAELAELTHKLFKAGQELAAKRNLYLADTKYEFGLLDGKIILIDEVHTPDSSRYFYLDSYRAYLKDRSKPEPKHLSKEFVREWLMDQGWSGQTGSPPAMPDSFVESVSERYIELYEEMSGQKFIKPAEDENPLERIEANINKALKELK